MQQCNMKYHALFKSDLNIDIIYIILRIICEVAQMIIHWLPDDHVGTHILYSDYWGG